MLTLHRIFGLVYRRVCIAVVTPLIDLVLTIQDTALALTNKMIHIPFIDPNHRVSAERMKADLKLIGTSTPIGTKFILFLRIFLEVDQSYLPYAPIKLWWFLGWSKMYHGDPSGLNCYDGRYGSQR